MRPTANLIPSLFASYGLTVKLEEYRLMSAWATIVGPQIAGHTVPREILGKVLWVVVDSSTWLHELTLFKPLLLNKLAHHATSAVVRDVRFVIGELPDTTPTEASTPQPRPLTSDEERALDQAVAEIGDAAVREQARRLLRVAAAFSIETGKV